MLEGLISVGPSYVCLGFTWDFCQICSFDSLFDGSELDCGSRNERRFRETAQKKTSCETHRVYEGEQEK